MKLYYKPGACSLATHIVLRELGREFTLEAVDTKAQRTESGADFSTINPKGYVPVLDTGEVVITEGAAVLQYLAESTALLPPPGTLERIRVQEYLNYTASEVHKSFGPFFKDGATDEQRALARNALMRHFGYLESKLSDGRRYLVTDSFTVVDAYLFVVCNWTGVIGMSLDDWPSLQALVKRIRERPAVVAAMRAEGLLGS